MSLSAATCLQGLVKSQPLRRVCSARIQGFGVPNKQVVHKAAPGVLRVMAASNLQTKAGGDQGTSSNENDKGKAGSVAMETVAKRAPCTMERNVTNKDLPIENACELIRG